MKMTIEFDTTEDDIELIQQVLININVNTESKEQVEYTDRQLREMALTDKVASMGVAWISDSKGNKETVPFEEAIKENWVDSKSINEGWIKESVYPNTIVDSNGDTWDESIHSSSKAKNADGTWKKKRGAAKQVPIPPVSAVYPTPPTPPAPPVTIDPELTIGAVRKRIIDRMMSGAITFDAVDNIVKSHEVENFADLENSPDSWSSILEQLGA